MKKVIALLLSIITILSVSCIAVSAEKLVVADFTRGFEKSVSNGAFIMGYGLNNQYGSEYQYAYSYTKVSVAADMSGYAYTKIYGINGKVNSKGSWDEVGSYSTTGNVSVEAPYAMRLDYSGFRNQNGTINGNWNYSTAG